MMDSETVTTALLRERLAGTRMSQDPTGVVMPPGSAQWPTGMRECLSQSLKPAGVLIPIVERAASLSVLLTQRSAELKHHAAQISFPGGGMEDVDADILATALRETHEEVGIAPREVSVIGYLEPMPTVTGYAVTAVVGLVSEPLDLIIDTTEVEYAFEVPLSFLLDRRNQHFTEREFQGKKIPTIEFFYANQCIWGATAHMLVQLRKYILKE